MIELIHGDVSSNATNYKPKNEVGEHLVALIQQEEIDCALEMHFRLQTFMEDWDYPGMEDYDNA